MVSALADSAAPDGSSPEGMGGAGCWLAEDSSMEDEGEGTPEAEAEVEAEEAPLARASALHFMLLACQTHTWLAGQQESWLGQHTPPVNAQRASGPVVWRHWLPPLEQPPSWPGHICSAIADERRPANT